jgi:hypothetical protein
MRTTAQSQEILELIGQTLLGQKIPASEVWNQLMMTKSPNLLDPVQLSAQYGPAIYQQAVLEQLQREMARGDRNVYPNLVRHDMAMRMAGIPSNVSRIAQPPTTYFPIAPDIHYKRAYRTLRHPDGYPVPGSPGGTVMEILNLSNVPMMDWDVKGPDHADRNVTSVKNLGDLEERLRPYVQNHPDSFLQVYQTPGGFRAWELGGPATVEQFQPNFEELDVDPDYSSIGRKPGPKRQPETFASRGITIDPPGFRSRISHKPGRVDWVAQPIFEVKGAEADPNPRSVQLIEQLHDEPIRRHYLGESGVSPDAMVALQKQLPHASQTLQKELRRRFRL